MLLEKAYAKAYECYANIESGVPGQGLRDLTGAPYDYLIGDLKNSWRYIQEGL